MISNVDQLIEQANLIENETERVNFVMNYFLQNVKYDYGYLLAGGYMQGTISKVALEDDQKRPLYSKNSFSRGTFVTQYEGKDIEVNDTYCQTGVITVGESELFNKVVELEKQCFGKKDDFLLGMYDLFVEELSKHLDNKDIIAESALDIVTKYRDTMQKGEIKKGKNVNLFIAPDINKTMLFYMIYPNFYMPPIIENGLMKKGVCQHYADYFADLFPKIGIPCIRIDGTSELGHAWNAVLVDGRLKSIDLTRAAFIRDKWKGIPSEQKSSDWLLADFPDTFKWQATRSINAAGMDENHKSIPLGYTVKGNNFNEENLTDLVIKYSKRLEGRERK